MVRATAHWLNHNPLSYTTHGCRAASVTTIKSQDCVIMRVTGHSSHTDRSMVVERALSNGWQYQQTSDLWMGRECFNSCQLLKHFLTILKSEVCWWRWRECWFGRDAVGWSQVKFENIAKKSKLLPVVFVWWCSRACGLGMCLLWYGGEFYNLPFKVINYF